MLELIGNTVRTDAADYPCKTRERRRKPCYMTLKARGERGRQNGSEPKGAGRPDARTDAIGPGHDPARLIPPG